MDFAFKARGKKFSAILRFLTKFGFMFYYVNLTFVATTQTKSTCVDFRSIAN